VVLHVVLLLHVQLSLLLHVLSTIAGCAFTVLFYAADLCVQRSSPADDRNWQPGHIQRRHAY
jgi:hypothetical protein